MREGLAFSDYISLMKSYPFGVLGISSFKVMVIFLVPRYCFCAGTLVRNCDIRQRRALLATNKKECVLLAAQAGYTAQASGFYCFGTREENFIQFNDALSLKKQAGFNPEHQNDGFLMGHPCRPPDMHCGGVCSDV